MSQLEVPDEISHNAIYRFYPSLEQVRACIEQAGLIILKEGHGSALHHFIARASTTRCGEEARLTQSQRNHSNTQSCLIWQVRYSNSGTTGHGNST